MTANDNRQRAAGDRDLKIARVVWNAYVRGDVTMPAGQAAVVAARIDHSVSSWQEIAWALSLSKDQVWGRWRRVTSRPDIRRLLDAAP